MEPSIYYLCDGEKEDCAKDHCYKKGGWCDCTKDVRHAKNFQKSVDGAYETYCEKEDAIPCDEIASNH